MRSNVCSPSAGNSRIYACATPSRDAKFCVSQARIGNKVWRIHAWHCRVFCSGDAKFCVSTGVDSQNSVVNILLPLPRLFLVRRKILRLYWGRMRKIMWWIYGCHCRVFYSWDARFCVSTGWRHRYYSIRQCGHGNLLDAFIARVRIVLFMK